MRKQSIVNYQSNADYCVGNEIIYITEVLKSNLCHYNVSYILVRDEITIVADNGTQVAFKNCASFTKCIAKSDGTSIDDAGYFLSFYSKNETTNSDSNIANNGAFKFFSIKLNF